MATFKDKAGREWALELDVPTIERLESRIEGFKVDGLLDKNGVYELFDCPQKFVRVLWVLVEAQAQKLKVGPEKFAAELPRAVLDAAGDAFMAALADFTPRHRRKVTQAMVARARELEEETNDKLIERLNAVPLSELVTRALESSESTPAPPG